MESVCSLSDLLRQRNQRCCQRCPNPFNGRSLPNRICSGLSDICRQCRRFHTRSSYEPRHRQCFGPCKVSHALRDHYARRLRDNSLHAALPSSRSSLPVPRLRMCAQPSSQQRLLRQPRQLHGPPRICARRIRRRRNRSTHHGNSNDL